MSTPLSKTNFPSALRDENDQQTPWWADELATAPLWGSVGQLASLLGLLGVGAGAAAVAAGGVASSVMGPELGASEEISCFGGGYCEAAGVGGGPQVMAARATPSVSVTKQTVVTEAPTGPNVIWIGKSTDGPSEEGDDELVARCTEMTATGKETLSRFLKANAASMKAMTATGKLKESELTKQGWAKQSNGGYIRIVQKEPMKVKVEAEEVVTTMKKNGSQIVVTQVEVPVPKLVWDKEVYQLVQEVNLGVKVNSTTSPTLVEREHQPVEVQVIHPKKKATRKVVQETRVSQAAVAQPAMMMQAAPMMMMQATPVAAAPMAVGFCGTACGGGCGTCTSYRTTTVQKSGSASSSSMMSSE